MRQYILSLLLFTSILHFTPSQECSDRVKFFENRCEGFVNLPVRGSFDLVALHRYRLYKYIPGDVLNITFYSPQNAETDLLVRKTKKDGKIYEMRPSQQKWNKGWQKFTSWSVDDFLSPNNIKATHLGVKIQQNETYLPASLHTENSTPTQGNSYRFYFDTPTSISNLKYSVIDKTGGLITEGEKEDEDAQSIFTLKTVFPESAKSGVYKLVLNITWINGRKLQKEYNFYHKTNVE